MSSNLDKDIHNINNLDNDVNEAIIDYAAEPLHSLTYVPTTKSPAHIVTIKATRLLCVQLNNSIPYEVKMNITEQSAIMTSTAQCDNYICEKIISLNKDYKGVVVNSINITIRD